MRVVFALIALTIVTVSEQQTFEMPSTYTISTARKSGQ
jgi:hypothetical protein